MIFISSFSMQTFHIRCKSCWIWQKSLARQNCLIIPYFFRTDTHTYTDICAGQCYFFIRFFLAQFESSLISSPFSPSFRFLSSSMWKRCHNFHRKIQARSVCYSARYSALSILSTVRAKEIRKQREAKDWDGKRRVRHSWRFGSAGKIK